MTMLKKTLLASVAIAVMTGFVGCGEDEVVAPKKEEKKPVVPTSNVLFDGFSINKIPGGTVGEDKFSAQSLMGTLLGAFVDEKQDSLTWGGGFWYGYASKNGAMVTASDEKKIVVAGADTASANNAAVEQMFGNDSLNVVFNCKTTTSKEFWAGIGVNIAGDTKHMSDKVKNAKVKGDKICWDMTKLKSITIDGIVFGAVNIKLGGLKSDDKPGNAFFVLESEKKENFETDKRTFKETIPVDKLVKGDWEGATWDEIKSSVVDFAIELNTEKGDYASLKINDIVLNFENSTDKFATFPFLELWKDK